MAGGGLAQQVAQKLADLIQCQDVYPELMEDLQKLVASPMVTESEFPSTFLKALSTSGVETKLKNCVFHLMRSKGLEKWILEQHSGRVREPLVYVAKVQSQWEKRVLKSLSCMLQRSRVSGRSE